MCIKACTSINNYQLVWLFIRKINRRRALLPLRDQDKESVKLQEPRIKKAVFFATLSYPRMAVVCPPPLLPLPLLHMFVFVCDLGSKLIMSNAPGKPMSPPFPHVF